MNFKKMTSALSAAALVFSLAACSSSAPEERGYEGAQTFKAEGISSEITVTVDWVDGVVARCEIDASGETPSIGVPAAEKLAEEIVKADSYEVDVISGATVTSEAVIEAAKKCFEAAGITKEK